MTAPFLARWLGDTFEPLHRFHNILNAEFVVGQIYRLVIEEERSTKTHNHYFACIHDAWLNLPEDQAERFPNDEFLRKYALIHCGYRDERTMVCSSKAEALRFAAFVRPMDQFAIVTVSECVVRVWTAQSQSKKAMGAKAFQQSKSDALAFLDQMIGADIRQHAGKAA